MHRRPTPALASLPGGVLLVGGGATGLPGWHSVAYEHAVVWAQGLVRWVAGGWMAPVFGRVVFLLFVLSVFDGPRAADRLAGFLGLFLQDFAPGASPRLPWDKRSPPGASPSPLAP